MKLYLPCGFYFREGINKQWNIEFIIHTLYLCNKVSYIKKKKNKKGKTPSPIYPTRMVPVFFSITIVEFCHCFQKKTPNFSFDNSQKVKYFQNKTCLS